MPVTGYVIWFNGTGGEKELTLTSPHEKHTVMGLEPNTAYAFRVAAISARGTGEFCEPVLVTTLQSTPTGSPILLNVTAVSSSSLHVAWSPPESTHKIVQYRIQYRVVSTENSSAPVSSSYEDDSEDEALTTKPPVSYSVLVNASDVTSANVTALQPFTVYEITVAAVTTLGYGPDSGPLRRRTLEDADDEEPLPGKSVLCKVKSYEIVLEFKTSLSVLQIEDTKCEGNQKFIEIVVQR
ncbi:fibronectin type III domain protein [Oesophagostomum dentatum]|uniref:Fibronectin type III domain protein n=1 Tax=Oesophagostomum dentatum TaxID=61180 RepID=A0A0B1TLX8_OESDE|nr:fibronectin type III domain protein [Oesophagostomum dentatum]